MSFTLRLPPKVKKGRAACRPVTFRPVGEPRNRSGPPVFRAFNCCRAGTEYRLVISASPVRRVFAASGSQTEAKELKPVQLPILGFCRMAPLT